MLRCSDGTYYTGKTTDIKKRLRQHNGEIVGGAKYTKMRRPLILHYMEEHPTNSIACQREAYLRVLSHKEKRELQNK